MVVGSPFRRLPVYLLVSVSQSMFGAPIQALRQGLAMLLNELMNTPTTVEVAALALITFGDKAQVAVPLIDLVSFSPPELCAGGGRAMGAALQLLRESLDRDLVARDPEFKGDYKALVFLITDGPPTDPDVWAQEVPALRADRRIATIVAVGCGRDVDPGLLGQLTNVVLLMDQVTPDQIMAHFTMVSQSIRAPDEKGGGGMRISLAPPPVEPELGVVPAPAGPAPQGALSQPGAGETAPAGSLGLEERTVPLPGRAVSETKPAAPPVSPPAREEPGPAAPPPPPGTLRCILEDGAILDCELQPLGETGAYTLYGEKSGTYVVGFFKGDASPYEPLLRKLLGEHNVVQDEPYWGQLFAWPKAIVRQPRPGVALLRAPDGTMELDWFLGSEKRQVVADKHGPQKLGTWANALALAVRMARIVRRLHEYRLCHADLSFHNFLVDPPNNRAVLIGWDALVVPGVPLPHVQGTPDCMAPEWVTGQHGGVGEHQGPSPATDLHALATLVYWLLLQRHPLRGPKVHDPDPMRDEVLALGEQALFVEHPADSSNRPADLPVSYTAAFTPAVQRLVERAFVEGLHAPEKRPTAAEWERDLVRMADAIVPCANPDCPAHAFVLLPVLPVRCPFCAAPQPNVPVLPILHFYRPVPGSRGQFQGDDGHALVGWPDRMLHRWHVEAGTLPGPAVDPAPLARLAYDVKTQAWRLDNLAIAGLRVLRTDGQHIPVPPGSACALTSGQQLLLGDAEQSRLVYVQFLQPGGKGV